MKNIPSQVLFYYVSRITKNDRSIQTDDNLSNCLPSPPF